MNARVTWVAAATAGLATVATVGALLVGAGARGAESSVEVAAGAPEPASETAAPATLVVADERGRIVELSVDEGAEVAELADETTTGGAVGGLAVTGDRRTVFFASHDPLVGLPCDSTVAALDLASGHTTTIGPGFAPALSPDGGRLAYVATDGEPAACTYTARVRDLGTGTEATWGLHPDWAGHYGLCSLTWEPAGTAVVAQLCHGADTVLHRVDLGRAGAIGDATYIGPRDPERSWTAAAPGSTSGTVVVAERCCLSGDPLAPSHRLAAIDTGSGEATVLAELPPDVESVAELAGRAERDLVLVAFAFTADGSTERQLLRWADGETRVLRRGVVAAAW